MNYKLITIIFLLLSPLFFYGKDKGDNKYFNDTSFYEGYIAMEMINYKADSKEIDFINSYNKSNCRGFVIFNGTIDETDYFKSFFPIFLCEDSLEKDNLLSNNSKYYDLLFKDSFSKERSYVKHLSIKNTGKINVVYKLVKVRLKFVYAGNAFLLKYIKKKISKEDDISINCRLQRIISLELIE